MSTVSPNMGFPISTVAVDSGLIWEQNLNASLLTIDQHNHTSGNGVQIPTAGLNINAALPFNNQIATGLQGVVLTPQSTFSTLYGIYSLGSDLYFNDGAGNAIRITSGGSVNATSSGITSGTASASFVSSVLVVNAATNKPANIRAGSILLGNNVTGSNYLTLSPPSSMAANITETLPGIPAATGFMTMDSSGNMTASTIPTANGITGSNIALLTILGQNIASHTINDNQIIVNSLTTNSISNTAGITPTQNSSSAYYVNGTSSGSYSTTSNTPGTVTNSLITLPSVAANRPAFITFSTGTITLTAPGGANTVATLTIQGVAGASASTISTYTIFAAAGTVASIPSSAINSVDLTFGSFLQYRLQASCTNSGTLAVTSAIMNAFQV